MSPRGLHGHLLSGIVVLAAIVASGSAQTPQRGAAPAPPAAPTAPTAPVAPTRAEILRGQYGELRANTDLLSYHLDIKVEPDTKQISGKNTIKFRM